MRNSMAAKKMKTNKMRNNLELKMNSKCNILLTIRFIHRTTTATTTMKKMKCLVRMADKLSRENCVHSAQCHHSTFTYAACEAMRYIYINVYVANDIRNIAVMRPETLANDNGRSKFQIECQCDHGFSSTRRNLLPADGRWRIVSNIKDEMRLCNSLCSLKSARHSHTHTHAKKKQIEIERKIENIHFLCKPFRAHRAR